MRRLSLSLCLVLVVSGCSNPATPFAPATNRPGPVPPGGAVNSPHRFSIGEEVKATLEGLNGAGYFLSVTAPSDGTLRLRLAWNYKDGNIGISLTLDGVPVKSNLSFFGPSASQDVSIEGTVTVVAGRTYLVTIADEAIWDYGGIRIPFTLTTTLG